MSSGSGTPFDPLLWKLRGRVVDLDPDGRKVAAYACGKTVCDPARHQARLVDVYDGKKVYAMASECFHAPDGQDSLTTVAGCNPPFGLPNLLKVQFTVLSGQECFTQNACPVVTLTHDAGSGTWTGTLPLIAGTLNLEFSCGWSVGGGSSDPDDDYTLTISSPGLVCLPIDYPIYAFRNCRLPFRAGGAAPILLTGACCGFGHPDESISLAFTVTGYTLDRFVGRLVDQDADGKKVFAVGECCTPDGVCPITEDCCGCDVSPRVWSFTVAGVVNGPGPPPCACAGFNANWTVEYVGGCTWQTLTSAGVCTPGPPWSLNCDGVNWLLSTSAFGGTATYASPVASWKCFGPNTFTRLTDHDPSCISFPGSIVLTAA